MDAKLKKRWVKALRSGRYKQGIGVLQDRQARNCCLGVLCRINREKKKEGYFFSFLFDGLPYSTLPPENYCGLSTETMKTLAGMNDGICGVAPAKTFKEIADWIEKNL